jgi:hypothetical protein
MYLQVIFADFFTNSRLINSPMEYSYTQAEYLGDGVRKSIESAPGAKVRFLLILFVLVIPSVASTYPPPTTGTRYFEFGFWLHEKCRILAWILEQIHHLSEHFI